MRPEVHIEQAPSGRWFVSVAGWGRRFSDEESAREHYAGLVEGTISAI